MAASEKSSPRSLIEFCLLYLGTGRWRHEFLEGASDRNWPGPPVRQPSRKPPADTLRLGQPGESHTADQAHFRGPSTRWVTIMRTAANAIRREPWNKGKIVGQKAAFKPKDIWALRVRLQMEGPGISRSAEQPIGVKQCRTAGHRSAEHARPSSFRRGARGSTQGGKNRAR